MPKGIGYKKGKGLKKSAAKKLVRRRRARPSGKR